MNLNGYNVHKENNMPPLFFRRQMPMDPIDATRRVLDGATARLVELQEQGADQDTLEAQERIVEYWQTNLIRQENQARLLIAREELLQAERELQDLQNSNAPESLISTKRLTILAINGAIAELQRDLIPEAEKKEAKRARQSEVEARVHEEAQRMRLRQPGVRRRVRIRGRIAAPAFLVDPEPEDAAAQAQQPPRVLTPPSP